MKNVPVRVLRERLGPLLDRVAGGEQLVVTRRGRPVARLIPEREGASAGAKHPLRGSVLALSPDFDAPMEGLWDALDS